jgi:hypothetical protein
MIFEKFVPSDVARVHARDGVVHQKLGVEIGNARSRRYCAKGLTEIVAPLGKLVAIFLCFRNMPGLTIGGKYPLPCMQRIHFSPKSDCPNETVNHLARERDVECTLAAPLWLWNVQRAPSEVYVSGLDLLQSGRPRPGQQRQQMKLAAHRVTHSRQFGEPTLRRYATSHDRQRVFSARLQSSAQLETVAKS